jgi:hypothetical protein
MEQDKIKSLTARWRKLRAESSKPVEVTITVPAMHLRALGRRYYVTAHHGHQHLVQTAVYELANHQVREEIAKIQNGDDPYAPIEELNVFRKILDEKKEKTAKDKV